MANVLLRFQLALLEQAEAKAKVVLLAAQQAKDLSAATKRQWVENAKDALQQARAARESALDAVRSSKNGVRFRKIEAADPFSDEASTLFRGARRVAHHAKQAFSTLQALFDGGDLADKGFEILSRVPGGVGLLAQLGQLVKATVDESVKAAVKVEVEAFKVDLEAQRYRDDYQRRLKDEPDFRRAEARRTAEEIADDEDRLRAQGFGRSADFLDAI